MASAVPKGKKHKLVGRWKITTAGDLTMFPWAKGLPKDATFEVTDDLDFLPGDGCTDKFSQKKAMSNQSASMVGLIPDRTIEQLLLHDSGHDHDHPDPDWSPAEGTALRLELDSGETIIFIGEHKGKGTGTVSIHGPDDKHGQWTDRMVAPPAWAWVLRQHGGPHGIAD